MFRSSLTAWSGSYGFDGNLALSGRSAGRGEAVIAVAVLNIMTRTAKPVSVRIA